MCHDQNEIIVIKELILNCREYGRPIYKNCTENKTILNNNHYIQKNGGSKTMIGYYLISMMRKDIDIEVRYSTVERALYKKHSTVR